MVCRSATNIARNGPGHCGRPAVGATNRGRYWLRNRRNLAALAGEYRCVGTDTSAEAIELARRRFSGITFLCGKAPDEIRPWLARADVVLMTDVLEHVFDDRGLLEPIIDVCPPGAKLLLTVPADMRLWSPHDTTLDISGDTTPNRSPGFGQGCL